MVPACDGPGVSTRGAIVFGVLCALTGCGGSDPGERSPPPADPAQAYREAVNRQCLDASLDRDVQPTPGGSGSADLAAYLAASLRDARRSQRALEAIAPPPAVAEQHREGRRLGREAIALIERAQRSARGGEAPDRVLRRLEPPLNRRIEAGNRIAQEIGTPQCRQEPLDLAFSP